MPDYRKLYYLMFNAATDAEKEIDRKNYKKAREILEAAQLKAEQEYIEEDK
jgi:hypothetical protein